MLLSTARSGCSARAREAGSGEPGAVLPPVSFLSFAISSRARRAGVGVCVCGGVGSNGSAAPARPRGRRTFRGKRAAASDARRRPKPLLGETGLVVTGSLPRSQRRPNGRANRRTRHFSAERARRGQWHGVGAARECGWCRVMWSLAGRSALSSRDSPSWGSASQRRRPCLCTAGRPPSCRCPPPSRAPCGSSPARGGGRVADDARQRRARALRRGSQRDGNEGRAPKST